MSRDEREKEKRREKKSVRCRDDRIRCRDEPGWVGMKERRRKGERKRVYGVGMTGYGVGMSRDGSG